jgi:hypothetical protein
VLERAKARRHMLPYGKKDRPIYMTTSYDGGYRVRAKVHCGLVLFDFPGDGL